MKHGKHKNMELNKQNNNNNATWNNKETRTAKHKAITIIKQGKTNNRTANNKTRTIMKHGTTKKIELPNIKQ